MSASDPNSAIYVTDPAKDIRNKVRLKKFSELFSSFSESSSLSSLADGFSTVCSVVLTTNISFDTHKHAFSGGQDSIENHRKHGVNLAVDIPVKYLDICLEDDAELKLIRTEYGEGRMRTGEVKKRLIGVLTEQVEGPELL